MTKRVLVIAVHPDDETLGCGGTLLKQAAHGHSLHWLLLTSAQAPEFPPEQAARQEQTVEAVRHAYPFETLEWLRLPSARLDTLPLKDLVAAVRSAVARLRPELVIIPNRSDAHSDHRIGAQAALAVLKPFHLSALGVRRVLACEVASETEAAAPVGENFLPQLFVDVTGQIERKLEILGLFRDELQAEPLPRSHSSVRALARYRGAAIGVQYAEAFMVIREID